MTSYVRESENLSYHCARLLILIRFCGRPQKSQAGVLPGIEGRTLLAKLDFFLRYPAYLKKACGICGFPATSEDLGVSMVLEAGTVESRMVRYLYGPWDHVYYPALGYLIGKGLIEIEPHRRNEVFRITAEGMRAADQLAALPAYEDLAKRARTLYSLFKTSSGTSLKNFIYENFPEVVNRNIGSTI